ncbi:VSP [Giardia duodenalis]|uniref:VSP n=1 Tax=Giardia intestinalis (strain ATCC 50803 / WB clone C6) TaxID=184922 RepID=A0A644EXZ4_GIAIC|nr:VSP [Giardia intestinalis]KAE8301306.1 VSP [Giardia intestinalis]
MLVGIGLIFAVALADACSPSIDGCAECDSTGKKCTKCDPNDPSNKKYLKDGACVTDAECTGAHDHYADSTDPTALVCKACGKNEKPNTAGNACFVCPDPNCRRCNEANKCADCATGKPQADGTCPAATPGCHSSCKECVSGANTSEDDKCLSCSGDNYLKVTNAAARSGVCVSASACTSDKTHFAKEVTDSNGSKKMCLSCSDATHGIADCKKCSSTASSAQTELALVCSDCGIKWLSPLGNACLEKCPAGTYSDRSADGISVCASCHSTCAECNGNAEATSCTACYPGSVLSKGNGGATGTCIPECTGRYAENCEAGQCTAVVGGSKYCSKCKAGFAPVDGVCVPITQRTIAGCNPGQDGTCTSCKDAYFKESGGCYQSTTYPGDKLCTTASQGKCTTCANGQAADNQGSCPACPDGCSKCTAGSSPQQCSECFPGYYLDAGKGCKKCSETSGNIQGIPNCVSCAPPTGGNGGPVTCYIKTDGANNGGSTNKSGLSTGAIAGISVAAIVVVGGLVGFLCWWFICRGKA